MEFEKKKYLPPKQKVIKLKRATALLQSSNSDDDIDNTPLYHGKLG